MALAAPFLIAGYPTSTPTAPTPPHETTVLDTLTFSADWDPDEAHPLSVGPDGTGTSGEDLNVNNLTDMCGAPDEFPGPACMEATTCVDDETDHTLRGWEDGGSIAFDGADLVYGYGR